MTDICNDIHDEGLIPSDWTLSAVVPLSSKEKETHWLRVLPCSYRAITLMDHAMKLYERILEKRVREQVAIDEMHFGFMPGNGTIDAIFIVRQMHEKFLAQEKQLSFAFVD